MSARYELTIDSGTDVSSGIYDGWVEIVRAADDAAAVDGLTARWYDTAAGGEFVDTLGLPWFTFTVRRVR